MENYKICTRCVMDTTAKEITFNSEGVCSYCDDFDNVKSKGWYPNEEGKVILQGIVDRMKLEGKGKDYDCIIGLSGGIDSSYLAYWGHQNGLRMLAVHVDAGWNSELAVQNIEKIVKVLNIDLYTHVVDWESMQDLQYAYFKARVINQDVPQDHAFFAALYNFATKHNIRYVLNGSNIATESILPKSWVYDNMDSKQVKAIHRKFGRRPLNNYPLVSPFKLHVYYPIIKKMRIIKPLNYMPYTKEMAVELLERELGWKNYGGKHYESRFTKFYQSYLLPVKFKVDKRRAHYASLILSGQMSREEAITELKRQPYDDKDILFDIEYFMKKLNFSKEEYDEIMEKEPCSHYDYPNSVKIKKYFAFLKKILPR